MKILQCHRWFVLALCAGLAPAIVFAQTGRFRAVSMGIASLQIHDEDDPLSNDEPYLLAVRFRYRTDDSGVLVPNTLHVNRVL
jgi:hypothetical protein